MKTSEFTKMRVLEGTHWWFKGRKYLLRDLIRKLSLHNALILDAGCGTGYAREELVSGGMVVGLDASIEALTLTTSINESKCAAQIEQAPFQNDTFDLITALDLLEHLKDDVRALQELHRICKPGGHLFVTVPANQKLWSQHDKVLGHHRRYSIEELCDKVHKAGFTVCRSSYYVSAVYPMAAAYRSLRRKFGRQDENSDLAAVPKPVNSLLAALMRLESKLVWSSGLPFGLTAVLLARKE